eukprot:TRINITY_DN43057_c0_g1_i1.p1 TRINITY_DN43057_c0_g1~~TRINITY_DN43057_c0_g1_i1.p1  ORF type:complete len:383 (-),score=101.06 TRINITY_DN43057_c0_g1_i1:62-1210(-)
MPSSKPTDVDAQRILAIMDELKEKLTFLSVVTSQVLDGLQSEEGQQTCELLGPELVKSFSVQIQLEDQYVLANETAGHGEENEDPREDKKLLQKNTLELCRKMKAVQNINIVQELRNFQETRPNAVIHFLTTLKDMQELTLKRLTTTVEEEKGRAELLDYYKSREQEASKLRQQLEKDLGHIRREIEKKQQHRTEQLNRLKAALLDVKGSKIQRMNVLRTRFDTRMKEHQDAFKLRREELVRRIKALEDSNRKLRATSHDDEFGKKKTAKRYDMEVEGVIKSYDSQVKEMAYRLNENQEQFKKEQKQLNELREHFEKVDAEKEFIASEEAIADARRAKLEAEKKRRNDDAAKVQAFWRGITLREAFQADKKRRRKKGGKKKK